MSTPFNNPTASPAPARNEVVLVVDDAPDTLGLLCHTLEAAGYTMLMAHDGEAALQRLDLVCPDAILLDAMMPGLSGFEVCRRIKATPAWHHIPVIFMTGLSEVEHLVQGFDSGGVDYVVKPVRAEEVLVRLSTHVRNARVSRLAREAVDVGGHGVVLVDARGRVAWRSPQAERWLLTFFPEYHGGLPPAWLHLQAEQVLSTPVASVGQSTQTLVARHLGNVGLGETMLLLRLATNEAGHRLSDAALTPREAEVLSWLAKGKTNRDIADILGMSPRTVNKHLEHIFEKLGVETRTAAAALASREWA
jgi:DNA-binding response OmpR family regulator/DNA-binding CsgD family transcriptional regulator